MLPIHKLVTIATIRFNTLITHFRRLLSSITHLIPSIVQFEHVTSPSAVIWYLCMTSHLTFLARHAAHAFAALRLTGFGFPLLSNPAEVEFRFFDPEADSGFDGGDCEALEPWIELLSFAMMQKFSPLRDLRIRRASEGGKFWYFVVYKVSVS